MTYIQLMPFPSSGRFMHVQYMSCVHFFSSVMTVDLMTGLISTGIHYRKPCLYLISDIHSNMMLITQKFGKVLT